MSVDLLPQERVVFDIVQDYLNKNRQFDIDNLIPYISYYLRRTSINLNYEGIRDVLSSLVKKKFLIEGSKLTHDDVLKNDKRKKIYNHILKSPGIYFTKLVNDLGYSNHVVVWHLSILIKFNFIKKRILDKHEIFFDSSIELQDAKLNFYITLKKSKMIINFLRKGNTGMTKSTLSRELKMHPNTISKYIRILQKFNLIIEEKIDNQILYFLEEEFLAQIN